MRAGCFVPEVVLEKPEQLTALHEEFVHSGSDVVEAYTVSNLQLFGLRRLNLNITKCSNYFLLSGNRIMEVVILLQYS